MLLRDLKPRPSHFSYKDDLLTFLTFFLLFGRQYRGENILGNAGELNSAVGLRQIQEG